ncbi:MAG: 4'-phosphopantetheinyl transferase family protein [Halodesulfovibrio sp.]
MALPDSLARLHIPPAGSNVILCAGLRLEGDAQDWITACTPLVAEEEKERATRFVHAADAARHMVGRALARRCLAAALGHPVHGNFAVTQWGKPVLAGTDMDFSISHSGDMVWAALCRGSHVGIDVEEIRPVPELEVLTAALHPHERADVFAAAETERLRTFYRCWTRKEAVLKAAGTGLNATMDSFEVCTDNRTDAWVISTPLLLPETSVPALGQTLGQTGGLTGTVAPHSWTACDINTDAHYHCSVAACAPQLEVSVFRLPDAGSAAIQA